MAAASGGADVELVAGGQREALPAREVAGFALRRHVARGARRSRASAGQAPGARGAAGRRSSSTRAGSRKSSRRSIPSPPGRAPSPPDPRRTVPESTRTGELILEGLDRRVARVRHVRVQRVCPRSVGRGAGAAGQRLVVRPRALAVARGAERQVAHRPGAGGGHARGVELRERSEQHVDDALAGLDVARGHGGGVARVDEAARSRDARPRERRMPSLVGVPGGRSSAQARRTRPRAAPRAARHGVPRPGRGRLRLAEVELERRRALREAQAEGGMAFPPSRARGPRSSTRRRASRAGESA